MGFIVMVSKQAKTSQPKPTSNLLRDKNIFPNVGAYLGNNFLKRRAYLKIFSGLSTGFDFLRDLLDDGSRISTTVLFSPWEKNGA